LESGLELIFKDTNIEFEIANEGYIILKSPSATTVSICGKITDTNGEPLPFATVFIKKSLQGTSADENGDFKLKVEIDPLDTIQFSYVGAQPQQFVAAELTDCPVISLEIGIIAYGPVVIREYITRGIEQAQELDHVVLHPDKIDVVPGLTEADVLQMVQILPGVQSHDESASGLHIRGGTPDQNLILWDGIPIYNSGHFFGMISAFNPFIVDNVKVYRGGFGAE
jgi:hypothetical protein